MFDEHVKRATALLRELPVEKLDNFNGMLGGWVRVRGQEFFVALSHADKAIYTDSDNPEDWLIHWADGHPDPVQLEIDAVSGKIRNWDKVHSLLRRDTTEVKMAEVSVKTYRRQDGTVVQAHKRWHEKIDRFHGVVRGEDNKDWHLYNMQNTKTKSGKVVRGRMVMVDPQSGDLAPSGTKTSTVEGYSGEKLTGYVTTGNYANGIYDPNLRWRDKIEEVVAMAKAEKILSQKVQADLAQDGWPESKRLALAVLLMNRHVFRVGGGTTNVTKGKDESGKAKAATYEDTFGLTTLSTDHVKVEGDSVVFEFIGKAAKSWRVIETDTATAKMITELSAFNGPGNELFGVNQAQVRDYIKPFGFTPHRFRTYWASYLFFKTAKDMVAGGAPNESKKDRQAILKAAVRVAAEKLSDTDGAALNNYILPSLVEQLLTNGSVDSQPYLHEYRLSESSEYWLPDEDQFLEQVWAEAREGGVELAEVHLAGPWPELQPGDHWVTLKPHGPDSDDYRRVIIREHPDGSAHVVWAGSKGLEHLRLGHVGTKANVEAKERKAKARVLTPEEKEQADRQREMRQNAVEKTTSEYGKAVAKAIGADHLDPEQLANALEKQGLKPRIEQPKTPQEIQEDRDKISKRLQQILDGELGEIQKSAPDPSVGVAPNRALAEASLADMIGDLPHGLNSSVPADIREAWDQARKNPEMMADVAAIRAKYQDDLKKIHKELKPDSNSIRVLDRLAFYDDPTANELALVSQAVERARYQMNSRFWHLNNGGLVRDGETGDLKNEPGLGAGSQESFYQGATDALNVIAERHAGARVNPGILQVLGPEVVAAAIASKIHTEKPDAAETISKQIGVDLAKRSMPTVAEALAIAEDADEEREKIKAESGDGLLTDAARMNALKNQTVRKQKSLARAAGSLELSASVADWLRRGTAEGVDIRCGDKLDLVRKSLEAVGLTDGQGYETRNDGHQLVVHVPHENLPKLVQAISKQAARDEKIKQIKDHSANSDDFYVPGMTDDVKLKPQQQATIRFLEAQGKVFGNLSVGIGKTITFGAAAARLIASGKAKNNKGYYIVPTNLINNTRAELESKFPGLKIKVAHMDQEPTIKTKEDRRGLYSKNDDYHILLIGQDTIRNDAKEIADACNSPDGPGFIFGDEVHAMFTPGDKGDDRSQSGRSRAMQRVRADYMLAMTGTPIRRSSAEVWKVLNWLRPGEFGSLASWALRYGKIGQGVSAYDDAINQSFQQEIDHTSITESDKPGTNLNENPEKIKLSKAQEDAYKREQENYNQKTLQPGADRRALSSKKVQRQREVLFASRFEDNPMLQRLHEIADKHVSENGSRGIIHCTSLKAVRSVVDSFKPGQVLSYVGDDALKRRSAIVSAINNDTLVTGGRVATPTGNEGVVTQLDDKSATVKYDNGQTAKFKPHELQSKVIAVAGTSTAVGVVSTGLNLQRGSTWTVHYQLADSGATHTQRDARNYRTGQTRDVNSYTLIPETPASREHWQKIVGQRKLMQAFDDPTEYDESELLGASEV